jgi:hypothetical protein
MKKHCLTVVAGLLAIVTGVGCEADIPTGTTIKVLEPMKTPQHRVGSSEDGNWLSCTVRMGATLEVVAGPVDADGYRKYFVEHDAPASLVPGPEDCADGERLLVSGWALRYEMQEQSRRDAKDSAAKERLGE